MKTQYNYIIVEDEPLQVENLVDILGQRLDLNSIGIFNTATDAYHFLVSQEGTETDIMFLDIQMPEKDGLSLLESINNFKHKPKAIIISAHEKYAIEGYNYDVAGYIVKPVIPQKLFNSINKVITELREVEPQETTTIKEEAAADFFTIKIKRREIKIFFKEFLFCESSGNDLKLSTLTENYELRGTLKQLENQLPTEQFMRIHNGFIINLHYIIGHENYTKVFLRYDIHSPMHEVPVGGTYRDTLKTVLGERG